MKAYVKPELFFESYELSQHIAACGWDMSDFQTIENCTAKGDTSYGNPDVVIYVEGGNCETIGERYCYQPGSGSESMQIFNS